MHFVALTEPAQDADRVLDGRLADHHGLEPTLEGRVLLDVLAIFVERGRTNRVQLTSREHRLEHVGGVHRPLGSAGTDDRVQLVDEQDHLPHGVRHFLQHRLQALLELAAVLRPGDESAHVESDDPLVLEAFRNVLTYDPLREPLDDRRLADAGFADKYRVVLGAAGEHLDHAPDLLVPADDGIELSFARELGEVAAVALERLVRRLRVLARDPLGAANGRERLQDRVAGDAAGLEQAGRGGTPALRGDRDQQVLGTDVFVLQPLRFLLGGVGHLPQPG
jgi:hypothetical protein